jgi:hypothetical protein
MELMGGSRGCCAIVQRRFDSTDGGLDPNFCGISNSKSSSTTSTDSTVSLLQNASPNTSGIPPPRPQETAIIPHRSRQIKV